MSIEPVSDSRVSGAWDAALRPKVALSAIVEEADRRGIPPDIVERIAVAARAQWDLAPYSDLLYSIYGRLAHWPDVGDAVARALSAPRLHVPRGWDAPGYSDDEIQSGLFDLEGLLTSETAANIRNDISALGVYPCQSHQAIGADAQPMALDDLPETASFACYSAGDVASVPVLMQLAASPALVSRAAAVCRAVPTVQTLRLFWTFPGRDMLANSGVSPMYLHRDLNDLNQFNVYIYLTDVGEGFGEHAMIPHTGSAHRVEEDLAAVPSEIELTNLFTSDGHQIDEAVKQDIFGRRLVRLFGPAGTAFGTDGFCYHQGCRPVKGSRLVYSIRYIVAPTPAKPDPLPCNVIDDDVLAPYVEASPITAYVFRHFLSPDSPYRAQAEDVRQDMIALTD